MGIAVTNDKDLYERLKYVQTSIGSVPSPFDCFMTIRGLKTLHVRMEAHAKNALQLATFLESHPKVYLRALHSCIKCLDSLSWYSLNFMCSVVS